MCGRPQEADTDDNQGTLDFDEFCAFYKMMSTRRDLYLLMLSYSNHKDYLDVDDLKRFLEAEQKVGAWDLFCPVLERSVKSLEVK
ncbi:UNVERIFIED_CONTAM: 1-phosphatidylinositol 4,5-bisphosphate phosphodiesterase eta-2 [Gekko kuhli]